jgi:hypothetical protein
MSDEKDFKQIMPDGLKSYKSNPNLKAGGVTFVFTKEQIQERIKCMEDPIYFIQNYMKIVHVDKGLVPFDLYDFQKELLNSYINNRFTIAKLPRQVGKCVCINSTVTLRYKKKYIITLEIGKLYEIVKDSKFEELLDLSKSICEEHEKQLLLATVQNKTKRACVSEESGQNEAQKDSEEQKSY